MNEFITCKIPACGDRPNHPIKLAHIDDIRPDALVIEGKPPCFYAVFYNDRKQVYFWCFESKEDRDAALLEVNEIIAQKPKPVIVPVQSKNKGKK
jgi:hypothetical protein